MIDGSGLEQEVCMKMILRRLALGIPVSVLQSHLPLIPHLFFSTMGVLALIIPSIRTLNPSLYC
jgi:hypothetical protein